MPMKDPSQSADIQALQEEKAKRAADRQVRLDIAIKRYIEGVSVHDIVQHCRVGLGTLRKELKKRGIEDPRKGHRVTRI